MSLNQSAQCSATCRTHAIKFLPSRFPIKTWEKSVGIEQPECPMPSRQCQWHHEKKNALCLWTSTKNCPRKQSQTTMQVSVMYLYIWLGCTRETRSSHSYSASTAVHPALAAIAARAGFRGTALVLVQEPVRPARPAEKTTLQLPGSSAVHSKLVRADKSPSTPTPT